MLSGVSNDKKARSNTFLMPSFDKFNSGMKKDLLNSIREKDAKEKRELEDNRTRDA